MNSPVAENAPAHGATSRFSQLGNGAAEQIAHGPVLEDPSGELEKELIASNHGTVSRQ
jgi:hypothetical protein